MLLLSLPLRIQSWSQRIISEIGHFDGGFHQSSQSPTMSVGQAQWSCSATLNTQVSSNGMEPASELPEESLNTAVLLGVPELSLNGSRRSAVEYGGDIVDSMLDSCFQSAAEFSGRRDDEAVGYLSPSIAFDHFSAYAELFKDSLGSTPENSSPSNGDESLQHDEGYSPVPVLEVGHSNEISLSTDSLNPTGKQSEPRPSAVFGNRLRPQPVLARSRNRLGRRKSKRAPAKPWSREEHEKFEEALEMFGRNWGECARYIGTRPAPLVRSHAQKYLIKLWKTGKPLPKKVAESGKGYTLSGKPLHPDSASARSYLTKIPCPQAVERKK